VKYFFLSLWYKFKSWQYERRCIKYFGAKPETIYLSQKDYDTLFQRINEPPDPETVEKLKKLFDRRAPWDEE